MNVSSQDSAEKVNGVVSHTDEENSHLHPMKRLGIKTFERDREKLLAEGHEARDWVAYHGDRLIGFAKDDLELIQLCASEAISREEVYFHTLHPIVKRISLVR